MAYHISSGITSSGIILSYDSMDISAGGVANSTTISSGYMEIYSGGVANSTTVNSGGHMYIYSGGVANSTSVNSGGYMYITSGGTANSTTVDYGGWMYISNGGVANSTTVNSRGYMNIHNGGVANNITVNNWGSVCISNGGTANSTTINSGYMYIYSGGVANSTTVNNGGAMTIASGGTATAMTLSAGGRLGGFSFTEDKYFANITDGSAVVTSNVYIIDCGMYISSGGVANSTTVNNGRMYISRGGVANSTTVDYGGSMHISSGGVANSTTVDFGGSMHISSGGVANSTTMSGGYMYISSGGAASNTTMSGGYIYISSGGTATDVVWTPCIGYVSAEDGAYVTYASNYSGVYFGRWNQLLSHTESMTGQVLSPHSMYVMSGGVANSTTVNSRGYMYIYSGGTANSTTVNSGGYMYIYSGGVANSTTINGSGFDVGCMYISSGGVANSTTVNFSGTMTISSGGTANSTTVNSGGYITISSGGTANSTTINSGHMCISSGGTATDVVWTPCIGYVSAEDGAYVTYASNYSGVYFGRWNQLLSHTESMTGQVLSPHSMYVMSGGVANSTTVNSGYMYISSGGTANSTTVNNWGRMYIYSGGVANSTIAGGRIHISSGGVANSTTVNFWGDMYISSGGVHRGSLQITSGAVVSAYSGSIIDFTVADRTASDGYLINDLSLVSGAPTYTITVSTTQAEGTYKLAQGAANFNETISIGDGTTDYGSITVNGTDLVRNGVTYSLDQANGNLTLTVTGGSASAVSNLTGNANGISWSGNSSAFAVEYSLNNFASVLQLETATSAVDTYQMPGGDWQVWVDSEAQTGFTATAPTGSATQVVSDADGNLDVFFVRTAETWDAKHLAKHLGDFNGWQGTKERVALTGKNIITDVFTGSTDANVLVLTDDSNGDALFLDDVFTALGNQARLSHIDEIRAGAGNDVIDLTSPKFAYLGDEMTVFGGSGDDVIWANSGVNTLYGDAGNDRIIGGSGNDFIIGGAGNDALHGGGGSDTFCFGANWGTDTVEQLANGKVILRFETGSLANWNAATKTYTNGTNTVTVTGTSDIELYFGTASTLPEDAFAPAASEKIFEQLA